MQYANQLSPGLVSSYHGFSLALYDILVTDRSLLKVKSMDNETFDYC
jgi:hypothetical protein